MATEKKAPAKKTKAVEPDLADENKRNESDEPMVDSELSEEESIAAVKDAEVARQTREGRRDEWGLQYDIWLIRAAKKKRVVEFNLPFGIPGITLDGNLVRGIPLRIDKEQVQFDVQGTEVWFNKSYMVATRGLNRSRTEVLYSGTFSSDAEPIVSSNSDSE